MDRDEKQSDFITVHPIHVLGMSDRVMVMWEGRSNGTLDIAEATQEKIMARATGIEMAKPSQHNK